MNIPPLGTVTALTTTLKRAVVRPGVLSVGRGQPVVMLHAALSSKRQWTVLADRIAPRFQAVAIDLNGHGDNPPAANGETYSIDDDADLVRSRIDSVVRRGEPVHLVGHASGALVALHIARRHPGAVKSLALYEPAMQDPRRSNVDGLRELQIPTLLIGSPHGATGACNSVALLSRTLPLCRVTWLDAHPLAPTGWPLLVNPLIEQFLDSEALRGEFLRQAA